MLCPDCFETHRLVRCGEDAAEVADQFAASALGGAPTPFESWLLGFARRPEAHLTDREVAWFKLFVNHGVAASDAVEEFTKRGPPAKPPVTGTHLGTVGERRLMTLTVESIKSLGVGEYGESFLCKMVDPHGNAVVWFTGENLDLDEGQTYSVKATVVEHTEFANVRQTRVNRLKVVTNGG